MFFEQQYECMAREDLEQLQLERLQSTLNRVSRNVPFYREKFEEMDIDPYDFAGLEDVQRLPFTTKQDIRDNYPYGLFAVPLREVVRLQSSSGTTGKPTVVGYTSSDVRKWSSLAARVLTAAGVSRHDVVQIALGYGLFTGGFGFHYGAELAGASVIPSSSGNTRRQVMIMQDYKTTALVSTPSYALHLADVMDEMGVNANSLDLRYGLFGAEPWSEAMRAEIEDRLKVQATDNYGVSEIMGPGVSGECLERQGLHVNEDHFLVEIVDPKTGKALPAGATGELVVTSLTKEAFPVIRFRTGDLTRLIDEPCACGRTLRRMGRVVGRSDDMLVIRGINVFPSQVETVIRQEPELELHYQIVVERENHLDKATVMVEAPEELVVDRISESQGVIRRLQKRLESELGVFMEVKLLEARTLERGEGKAQRVIDKREY